MDGAKAVSKTRMKYVKSYAEFVGLKLPKEDVLLWIAEDGLDAPLPKGWTKCQDVEKGTYFFNVDNGESIWEHPHDNKFKELAKKEQSRLAELVAETGDTSKYVKPERGVTYAGWIPQWDPSASEEDAAQVADYVKEYAKYLGMKLPEEKELLWIAKDGADAPLPTGWIECDKGSEQPYYFHGETNKSVWDHPQDAKFKELLKKEQKRFAEFKETHALWKAKQAAKNPPPLAAKKKDEGEGEAKKEDDEDAEPKYVHLDRNELYADWIPEWDTESGEKSVKEYATWVGIKPEELADFMWIAREGVAAPLPKDWQQCDDVKKGAYYFNFKTGESIWDHPHDEKYKAIVIHERARREKLIAKGEGYVMPSKGEIVDGWVETWDPEHKDRLITLTPTYFTALTQLFYHFGGRDVAVVMCFFRHLYLQWLLHHGPSPFFHGLDAERLKNLSVVKRSWFGYVQPPDFTDIKQTAEIYLQYHWPDVFMALARLKPELTEASHQSIVITACEMGSLPVVKFLIREGADAELRNAADAPGDFAYGCRPLHKAAEKGHVQIVKLLLERKVSLTAVYRRSLLRQGSGYELMSPQRCARAGLTKALSRRYAPLDERDDDDDDKIERRIKAYEECVRLLDEAGPDVAPPSAQVVNDYVKWYDVDPVESPELVWIAEETLAMKVPDHYQRCQSEKGEEYYWDTRTKQSEWEHPNDAGVREFAKLSKRLLAASKEEGSDQKYERPSFENFRKMCAILNKMTLQQETEENQRRGIETHEKNAWKKVLKKFEKGEFAEDEGEE